VIATEAVTEIIVASEFPLFEWIRTRLSYSALPETPRTDFRQYCIVAIYKLFTCGYCFSVWTAGFFALFAPSLLEFWFLNWVLMLFVIHRLSNWLHVAYELLRKGRVKTHDLEAKITLVSDEEFTDNEDQSVEELVEELEA
jgi:hypothetical protein